MDNKKSIIAVDIDGVIAKLSPGWDYEHKLPDNEVIEKVNFLYNSNKYIIVLYTARSESDRFITEQWMELNNVKYHTLVCGKLMYDYIIDDKSKNLEDLI